MVRAPRTVGTLSSTVYLSGLSSWMIVMVPLPPLGEKIRAVAGSNRAASGPSPILTVSQKFVEDLTVTPAVTHTEKINPKNATTDGVICTYCGNLNKQAYRGNCPQCPKAEKPEAANKELAEVAAIGRGAVARFKSLQGRILTIMDGSFSDKTQRDAVKSLINKEFRREISKVGGDE